MIDARALFTGRRLLVLGVLAYVVFTLTTFPARLAVKWFLPAELTAANVSGTVWSGRAGSIVAPQVSLSNTTWRSKPLALLTGRMRYLIDTHVGDGTVQGIATIFPGGAVELSEVAGVIPISALISTGDLNGRIGLDFARLRIEEAWIIDARGTADVVSLELLKPINESLGSYEFAFDGADDDGLRALFRDVAGPLEASGTLLLLPGQVWKLDGSVKAKAAASAQLRQSLTMALPPNADGGHTLSFSSD